MADDTWTGRELPILEAILRREQAAELRNSNAQLSDEIATELELDTTSVKIAIDSLIDAGYLRGSPVTAWGDPVETYLIEGLTEKARQAAGQWPSGDPYSSLVQLLEERIADTADPEVKSKLRAFRDAVLSVGQGVATSVLAELIKHQTGI
jgi:DNA-binding MarR family transcriptional regulator